MKYEIADVVVATAGRDIGQTYLVWKVESDKVFLVNGRSRKISNPKVKSQKHIVLIGKCDFLKDKLRHEEKINDSFLRKLLKNEIND